MDVVYRGGNLLLIVGPDAKGIIPAGQIGRLKAVGDRLKINGTSIYETRPRPFEPVDILYCNTYKSNIIYIHVIKSSKNDPKLSLPPIKQHALS
jgi:alpha-L-fucosidase